MAEKKTLGTSYIDKIDFFKINKCNIYYNYIIILILWKKYYLINEYFFLIIGVAF